MTWIDEPVLIHVGLHKTASSWLQKFYFSEEKFGFWNPAAAQHPRTPIKGTGQLLYRSPDGGLIDDDDFDANNVRNLLKEVAKPAGLLPVISNEGMAGHPFSGGFNRLAIAKRVNDVFAKPKVLVVIREQNALIMSSYMQYLKYGGWHTPERFIQPE